MTHVLTVLIKTGVLHGEADNIIQTDHNILLFTLLASNHSVSTCIIRINAAAPITWDTQWI